jgi:hypothetical protein
MCLWLLYMVPDTMLVADRSYDHDKEDRLLYEAPEAINLERIYRTTMMQE